MKKLLYLLSLLIIASMVLTACGGQPAATEAPAVEEPAAEEPAAEEPAATEPAAEEPAASDKVQIRWFVGLGTGTDPTQVEIQQGVVDDFNASQDNIELVLEVVPYDSARDTLATQIASGAGPDIVGPVGWGGSNGFYGQWLDITPYIESSGFDTSVFDPALLKFYQTEEGQVGLPFAVFPGAVYYVPAMFDEAGLNYPPQTYGEKYVMPDGTEVDWSWETLTEIAKLLTVDVNGANATEAGFDPTQIVQVGYSAQWQHPNSIATFYGGAAQIYEGDAVGEYKSTIPDSWKEAWRWYYEGMWGEQPFIATGPLSGAPEFGNGNVFNTGKAAMGLTQTWYTCCLGDFRDAGNEFQLAIQPMSADGEVHGRIDADTFRIWKGTPNPEEAFEVLSYLITTGGDKLLPAYGAMPAIASKTDAFFEQKSKDYPFVTPESWDVFIQGLAYPDTPSAEQYQPNWTEAFARQQTFQDLMNNTPPDQMDFDAEFQKLVDDLNVIYNK
jgi:multiple sugar transport system substrate-binding protein